MTFADARQVFATLLTHQFGAKTSVQEIRLAAVAKNAGRIGQKYAYIVEHSPFIDQLSVELQIRMALANGQGLFGHLPTVLQEQTPQGVVGRIVLIYNV